MRYAVKRLFRKRFENHVQNRNNFFFCLQAFDVKQQIVFTASDTTVFFLSFFSFRILFRQIL